MNAPIIKLQLDVPQDFLDKLDAAARVLYVKEKPMSKLEWIHRDNHGRAFINRTTDPVLSANKTIEQINKEVNDEYRKCVGPATVGRPRLRTQRLAIIIEAVNKYLADVPKLTAVK